MNWTFVWLMVSLTTMAFIANSEARGGRGGGGGRGSRGGGRRSGGGGLFGGSSSSSSSRKSSSHSSDHSSSSSYNSPSYTANGMYHPTTNYGSSFDSGFSRGRGGDYFGSSSSKTSSHSNDYSSSSPNNSPIHSWNAIYPHTVNYGNSFNSGSSKNTANDFLNGYFTGNLLVPRPIIPPSVHSSVGSVGHNYDWETTTTTTESPPKEDHLSDFLNNLNSPFNNKELDELVKSLSSINLPISKPETSTRPEDTFAKDHEETSTTERNDDIGAVLNWSFDEKETIDEVLNRISETNLPKLMGAWKGMSSSNKDISKLNNVGENISEMESSTQITNTEDTSFSTTIEQATIEFQEIHIDNLTNDFPLASTISKDITSDIPQTTEIPVTPSPETSVVVTESSLDTQHEITTPYGVICFPMFYNEVNEFGVYVTIERLGCYPAPEPIVPEEIKLIKCVS